MSTRRYHLKPGTILDERYVLGEVLGEGGFGITYEGKNLRIGMQVAIKEFFCRDYMDRDHTQTDGVRLIDAEMEERFLSEKDRFMKEARILGDFSSEPGIVHIIDYFESNGTAYIVMPFLDGQNLRQVVKSSGRIAPEELFPKMKPLLMALGKVHEAGLIHRDISPDNIMLLSDGSLCFIDFGAAYHFDERTQSYRLVGKFGYAAPELFKAEPDIRPAADLYSLTATLYYCLTGMDPEDTVQRILVDDMKMPEELGIKLPAPICELIRKGLSLKVRDRWQSAGEMLEKVKEAYPDPKEDSGDAGHDGKRRIVIAAAAAAAACILCLLAFLTVRHVQRPEYRFRNIETETIWLTAIDDMTVQEYSQSAATVKGRLEVFAGRNNYLWKEKDGEIRMELPVECFAGNDPEVSCKAYLTRPMNLYLIDAETERKGFSLQNYRDHAVALSREDIKSVELRTGEVEGADRARWKLPETGDFKYLEISLTEEAAARIPLSEMADADGRLFLNFDLFEDFANYYYDGLVSSKDGRSIYVINSDQEGSFLETLQYDLTHPASAKAFGVTAQWVLENEDALPDLATGENQVPLGELDGTVHQFRFESSLDVKKQKASWFHNLIAFKDRLDVLDTPYEFNLINNEQLAGKTTFAVTVPKDSLTDLEVTCISKASLSAYLGTCWYNNEIYLSGADWTFEGDAIKVSFSSSYDVEELSELIDKMQRSGTGAAYLYLNDYPLAECSLEDLRGTLLRAQEEARSEASDNYPEAGLLMQIRPADGDAGLPGISEKDKELILLIKNDSLAASLTLKTLYRTDRDAGTRPELLKSAELPSSLKPLYEMDPDLADRLKLFAEANGGLFTFEEQSGGNRFDWNFWFFECDPQDLAVSTVSFVEKVLTEFHEEIGTGIANIHIYRSLNKQEDADQRRMLCTVDRSMTEYRMTLYHWLRYTNFLRRIPDSEEYAKHQLEEANKYLSGSALLQQMMEVNSYTGEQYTEFSIDY